MARKESTSTVEQFADDADFSTMADAVKYLDTYKADVSENAIAVARQVGYDGTLTVGALEDEIRFYQRRTVEGVFELGKRLVVLQQLAPHGEFQQRIQMLGIDKALAYKFMKATMKFAKVETFPLLKVGSQSKLLELLVLDDGEIDALESGETVRGVTLDKIETMSVSELKKALRDANDRIDAKDKVIQDKSVKLDEQAEKLAGLENRQRVEQSRPFSAEQRLLDARTNLQATAANVKATVMTSLRKHIKDLHEIPGDHAAFAAGCLIEISRELIILRDEYNLPTTVSEDLTPEWMREGGLDDIEKQYAKVPDMTDEMAKFLSDEA
jgi:hypothetical protein